MSNPILLTCSAVLAILILSVLLHGFLKKHGRKPQLESTARQLGFIYRGGLKEKPQDLFGPLRLFCFPGAGSIENAMAKSNPKCLLFDYQYSIPRDQDVRQTVAVFTSTRRWPPFVIETRRKERFTVEFMRQLTKKIANWQYKFDEVDLTSIPEFAKSYRLLRQKEEKYGLEILPKKFLECLTANIGWHVEMDKQYILIYQHGKRTKPALLKQWFKEASSIFSSLET